ncbi:uncharacterized protein [Watersipora subatra]|uniref:uncharacterized protein n=1 Tax=Watersipora subatra TaxID=2589382 RepID=UPI00355AEA0D
MKKEIPSPETRGSSKRNKSNCRVVLSKDIWSKKDLESTLDLTGKRLHLFQLPPDMPIQCLDGVELPVPRKKKWSRPITVSYTTNKGKANEQAHTLALKAQKTVSDETLLEICDGKLSICASQPVSIFQGVETEEKTDIIVPTVDEAVHTLPPGLRQRFTPIGNGISQSQTAPMELTPLSSVKKAKRRSTSKKADAETPKKKKSRKSDVEDSDRVDGLSETKTISPKKRRR